MDDEDDTGGNRSRIDIAEDTMYNEYLDTTNIGHIDVPRSFFSDDKLYTEDTVTSSAVTETLPVKRVDEMKLYDTIEEAIAASKQTNHARSARSPRDNSLTDNRLYVRSSSNKHSWFMVFHEFWNSQQPNSFTMHERKSKRGAKVDQPIVKPTLKIYYTVDKESLGNVNLTVFSVYKDKDRDRSTSLHVVDLTYAFSRQHRIDILHAVIREAFQVWSDVLYDNVQFVEIPYDSSFQQTPYNERIVVVSARSYYHRNEHTGLLETFGQSNVLAHAYSNHLHVNVDTNRFYVGPHKQLDELVLVSKASSNQLRIQLVRKRAVLRMLDRSSDYVETLQSTLTKRTAKMLRSRGHLECIFCTFLHEIAHVLGLGHSDNAGSLMYPRAISDFTAVDELDKLAMRKLFRQLIDTVEYTKFHLLKKTCDKMRGKKRKL